MSDPQSPSFSIYDEEGAEDENCPITLQHLRDFVEKTKDYPATLTLTGKIDGRINATLISLGGSPDIGQGFGPGVWFDVSDDE